MNVLHININYAERPLHQELVRALTKCGVSNCVFCPTYDLNKCIVDLDQNVYYKRCFRKQDRWIYHLKQKNIIKAVEHYVNVSEADMIHAHTLYSDGNAAMRLGEKYNKPYVVAVRNTDINVFFRYKPWLIPLGIKIMCKASAIFFLSNAYKEDVIQNYVPLKHRNEIACKCFVMPNGIDEFWHENRGLEKSNCGFEKLKLLSVCEISRNKNILTTINAMQILKKRGIDCQLDIVGKVIDKTVYNRVISSEGVQYSQFKEKKELISNYRNADVFVMPSIHESFGLVYAEAMSQGLPVIYTRGQGFDGFFKNGEVGFAVECMNAKDIADKVEMTLNNYAAISKRCLDLSKIFSWKDIAAKYVEQYHEVMNHFIGL